MELERTEAGYICGECGQRVQQGYDSTWEEVQHLMLWHHLTVLRFKRYRVECPLCGIRTEEMSFVDIRGPRVSRSLALHVYEPCKVMTVKAVALFQGLHRETVKDIDKRALQKMQKERPLEGITTLKVDEIAVGKGHNYLHLVSAPESPRGPEMLYVGEGRKEKDFKKFWKWFGTERAHQITHAVMDMWKGFIRSFRTHCPQVAIIYDKFHILRHLLNALNTVRKDTLRKAGGRFRGLLVGKKFILLSRSTHVRGKAREALYMLLAANRRLLKAYILKEHFDHLWSYRSKTWARRFFHSWVDSLKWSRLTPYKRFAAMVETHLDGILAHCDKRMSLGHIEACDLKARNIIRRAYGYRDKDYMKLKIIQGCTPWMSQFRPWTVTHNLSS